MNIELLEQKAILDQLQHPASAQLDELVILDTVDSTNDYLLRLTHTQRVIACFAEQQTAGKGQRGKSWLSPGGQIYFSLLWQFSKKLGQIMGLSLAIGIAVVRALHRFGVGEGLQLKWPNDIYYQGQKLVGVLVETTPGPQGICNGVIGVGINLYATAEQSMAIDQPWTCVHHILQRPIARNQLAGILLNEILLTLMQFSELGLTPFQKEWQSLDYLYGKRVTITSPQQTLIGVMHGISLNGELLLLDDQQQQHVCLNGSVRLASL